MVDSSAPSLLARADRRLQRWVEDHPRLTGWTLVLGALGLALFLVGPFVVVVLFAWGLSPKGAGMLACLTLAVWAVVVVMVASHRSRDQRYSRARLRLLARAEAGDPKAMWAVAEAYRREPVHAAHWLRLLAESGDARAAYELALVLERGQGLVRDLAGARAWLHRAAEGGYGPAKVRLERKSAPEP